MRSIARVFVFSWKSETERKECGEGRNGEKVIKIIRKSSKNTMFLTKCLEGSVICVTTPNCFLSQTPTCNVKGVADLDKNGVPDLR